MIGVVVEHASHSRAPRRIFGWLAKHWPLGSGNISHFLGEWSDLTISMKKATDQDASMTEGSRNTKREVPLNTFSHKERVKFEICLLMRIRKMVASRVPKK